MRLRPINLPLNRTNSSSSSSGLTEDKIVENHTSEVYGRIPFSDSTILGIPWVLFFLLALSLGLLVTGLWNITVWLCMAIFRRKPKNAPTVESPTSPQAVVECDLSSPVTPQPDLTLPSIPPPSYQQINGEFRGSRSMPPTYVPTPFVAQPSFCYYY